MSPDLPLFAYGTLMFPLVIGEVIGRIPDGRPGTVDGHLRLEVAGHTFPGLIPNQATPDATVNGILYHGLEPEEWQRLNEFEDDFYVLSEVPVRTADGQTITALAYLVPESSRSVLNNVPWNEEFFRQRYLESFVSGRQG